MTIYYVLINTFNEHKKRVGFKSWIDIDSEASRIT